MSKVYTEIYLEKGLSPSEEAINNFSIEKKKLPYVSNVILSLWWASSFMLDERKFFTIQQQTYAVDFIFYQSHVMLPNT